MSVHRPAAHRNKTALITGASTGIGFALAEVFARHDYDLILVSSHRERIEKAAASLRTKGKGQVTAIARDLCQSAAPAELFEEVQAGGLQVDVLVNNAGYGTFGAFADAELESQLAMMQLNMMALTHLTHLCLQGMQERKSGKVLNIASTAAFQPGPLMAVYFATKAFVLSFSEALANELKGSGISVTALCPGPTRSEFQKRAKIEESRLVKMGLMEAEQVARAGFDGLMAGKTIVVPGVLNKVTTSSVRFVPRSLAASMARKVMDKA